MYKNVINCNKSASKKHKGEEGSCKKYEGEGSSYREISGRGFPEAPVAQGYSAWKWWGRGSARKGFKLSAGFEFLFWCKVWEHVGKLREVALRGTICCRNVGQARAKPGPGGGRYVSEWG